MTGRPATCEGGEKVFVFHTVDLHTHALGQSSSGDKSTASVCAHLLQVCAGMGVPDFLQLDNDAAFTGLGKTPGVLGRFVRLALYLGIELVFIPPGEPQRNSLVEGLHHLWARSFWSKNHFASVKAFQRKSPQFLAWYDTYAPPALHGLTVKEARMGGQAQKTAAPSAHPPAAGLAVDRRPLAFPSPRQCPRRHQPAQRGVESLPAAWRGNMSGRPST